MLSSSGSTGEECHVYHRPVDNVPTGSQTWSPNDLLPDPMTDLIPLDLIELVLLEYIFHGVVSKQPTPTNDVDRFL